MFYIVIQYKILQLLKEICYKIHCKLLNKTEIEKVLKFYSFQSYNKVIQNR